MTWILERAKESDPVAYEVFLVAVKEYGSEGLEPLYRNDCRLEQDGGDVSCIGGSGSTFCAHYMGEKDGHVIMCNKEPS